MQHKLFDKNSQKSILSFIQKSIQFFIFNILQNFSLFKIFPPRKHLSNFFQIFFTFLLTLTPKRCKMFIFVIKKLRNFKNISLTDLSDKSSISTSYLSKLENNNSHNCSLETLKKISDALEVNIKDLFYTTSDIEDLKEELNEIVDEYGLSSPEALEQSQLIDQLINLLYK